MINIQNFKKKNPGIVIDRLKPKIEVKNAWWSTLNNLYTVLILK